MSHHPKVLLLCSLSQNTANGITIANLFKGWPKERIALAEFSDGPDEVCVPGIGNYYFFGNKEVRFIAPFHLLRKFGPSRVLRTDIEAESGKLKAEKDEQGDSLRQAQAPSAKSGEQNSEERTASSSATIKNAFNELLVQVQRWYLSKTGLMLVSRKFRISPEFEEWVQEFKPDIIYCVTGDLCKLEFFHRVLKHFNRKGCIHVFDDFLASKHEGTLFPNYWRKRLDQTFRQVCQQCSLHLAIGDKMAEEYTDRYGQQFHGFHNPIDPSIWLAEPGQMDNSEGLIADGESDRRSGMANSEGIMAKEDNPPSAIRHPLSNENESRSPATGHRKPATDHRPPKTEFRFLYAGKINKDTVGPIQRFIAAVEQLNAQGHKIAFKIHSPYPLAEIERLLGANAASRVYAGKLPYDELPAAYRAADGLLLPLDFTEATIRYIRLSMLTKASEYMISGTPIFCFAPKEIAVSEYLLAHDAAIHCGDPKQLETTILEFIEAGEGRKRVAVNAVERAKSHHMMGKVNERLLILIEQSVSEAKSAASNSEIGT